MRPADPIAGSMDAMELEGRWKKMPVGDSGQACGKRNVVPLAGAFVLLVMICSAAFVFSAPPAPPAQAAVDAAPLSSPAASAPSLLSPVLSETSAVPEPSTPLSVETKGSSAAAKPRGGADRTLPTAAVALESAKPRLQESAAQQAMPSPSPLPDEQERATSVESPHDRAELLLI